MSNKLSVTTMVMPGRALDVLNDRILLEKRGDLKAFTFDVLDAKGKGLPHTPFNPPERKDRLKWIYPLSFGQTTDQILLAYETELDISIYAANLTTGTLLKKFLVFGLGEAGENDRVSVIRRGRYAAITLGNTGALIDLEDLMLRFRCEGHITALSNSGDIVTCFLPTVGITEHAVRDHWGKTRTSLRTPYPAIVRYLGDDSAIAGTGLLPSGQQLAFVTKIGTEANIISNIGGSTSGVVTGYDQKWGYFGYHARQAEGIGSEIRTGFFIHDDTLARHKSQPIPTEFREDGSLEGLRVERPIGVNSDGALICHARLKNEPCTVMITPQSLPG